MSTDDKLATAWLEVETRRGTRQITRVDMDCTDSPTVRMDQDRHRICNMSFPADQQDMRGPLKEAMIKAFAAIVMEGLTGDQIKAAERAAPRLIIQRISALKSAGK